MKKKSKSKKDDTLMYALGGLGIFALYLISTDKGNATPATTTNSTSWGGGVTTSNPTNTGIKAPQIFTSAVSTAGDAVKVIISANSSRSENTLKTFEPGYLIAWANGIIKNNATFAFNGNNYTTATGKFASLAMW